MTLIAEKYKPAGYTLASLVVSLGGFLNGLDSGCIGAVTVMPQFSTSLGPLTPFLRGFLVSLIMLAATVPSLFAGQLADRFGRLVIVGAGALMFVLGTVLEGTATLVPMFLVGRALAGLGEGFWLSNVSVYICEIAPSSRRGTLVSLPQLASTMGICAGYFICYGTQRIESSMAWRVPFVIQAVLGLVLALSCIVLPNSPRWLVIHGLRDQALKEIERLNIQRAEAEKDILRPPTSEDATFEKSPLKAFLMLFRRQYRKKTFLALFVLGMVQLSGVDGVIYYAPILFERAGLPQQTAGFIASGVSAILMCAISVPAIMFADKWGRRTSAITGGVGLSATMFIIGGLYASQSVHAYGVGRWFVVVSIFAFVLMYCVTWAVVGKIYASEIQPAKTRAAANCVAQGLNFFTNWLVAFITPLLLADSSYGVYFLYGGLSLATVIVLAFYMPETRNLPLESIHEAFSKPAQNWSSQIRRLGRRRNNAAASLHRPSAVPSERTSEAASSTLELSEVGSGSNVRLETFSV